MRKSWNGSLSMYRFVVVTDPDTASGFRLAGVEVIEAKFPQDAGKIIPDLLYKDDMGIVAVNEDFMPFIDEHVMTKIEESYRPLIIPIPIGSQKIDRTSYIERLLRKAIGYNITLQ